MPKNIYDYHIAKMLQTFCGTTIWNKTTPAYTLKSGVEQYVLACASTMKEENVMAISEAVSTSMLVEMGANHHEFCQGYRQRLNYLFENKH